VHTASGDGAGLFLRAIGHNSRLLRQKWRSYGDVYSSAISLRLQAEETYLSSLPYNVVDLWPKSFCWYNYHKI
jgi:hypothetical protein